MRKRLLASGQQVGWGTMPRQMLTDLYSIGLRSFQDFPRLEQTYRWRSEIAHGFAPPKLEPDAIEFLTGLARRLLEESQAVKQPARFEERAVVRIRFHKAPAARQVHL